MSSKRSLSPSDSDESSKRRRLSGTQDDSTPDDAVSVDTLDVEDDEVTARASFAPTHHANARASIQRSIAMVLRHDGFASSSPDAMESFTSLVETCELRPPLRTASLQTNLRDRPRIHH